MFDTAMSRCSTLGCSVDFLEFLGSFRLKETGHSSVCFAADEVSVSEASVLR